MVFARAVTSSSRVPSLLFMSNNNMTQLIQLYTRAGFPKEELQTISDQLLIQHQNSQSQGQTCAYCLFFPVVLVALLGFCSGCLSLFSFGLLSFLVVGFLVAVFFAASWLNHRSYPLPCGVVTSNGSRSRPCLSSPPGSGHYASKPPGGASPFLRAIH